MKLYVVEESALIDAEHGDGVFVYKADDVDARIRELRSQRMTQGERLAVIEECARALEAAANQLVAVGNEYDEGEERDSAYAMAHDYDMAASEVRRMNPAYVARENRNLRRVREWIANAKTTGDYSNIPVLEPSQPKDN